MIERVRIHTTGADAVEETWRAVVPSAHLRRASHQQYRFSWSSATWEGVSVVAYDLDAPVRSHAAPEDQIMVCRLTVAGGGAWDEEGALNGDLPWATDGRPISARWDGRGRVHALVFDRSELERAAHALTGREHPRPHRWDTRPISGAAARHWERTYRYVASSVLGDPDEPSALAAVELRRLAAHATLVAFSPTFLDDADRTSQRRAAPTSVRRALSFIEAHADQPIGLDDIARAAGMSTRGLQYAFRRALDVTPMQALRHARLVAVREELRREETTSVAEIARRWGFIHPSRFTAHYRAAFGESPHATRRNRG